MLVKSTTGAQKQSILNFYPGKEYVDIVGINYYDGWPALSSQTVWDQQYSREHLKGPWGIGAWCQFASDEGKRFSCSEWGINNGRYGCIDNAFYIEQMWQFFSNNAANIAYENYFNQKPYHQLTPGDVNPNASAKYKRLWGVGA